MIKKMNELDCVKLIKPYWKLKIGTLGYILIKYDENNFEVEFVGDNNNTLDVSAVSRDYLELDEAYKRNN